MKNPVVNALIHTFVLIAVLTVNALANILPINGLNTGEVSALYPSLFTPAGITFSIWSVIYLLLLAFVLWQWIRLRDTRTQEIYWQLSPYFILSSVFNISWILVWHFLYVWISVIIMLAFLVTLTLAFLKLQQANLNTRANRFFISLPLTTYFAWICVATIANIATALVSLKLSSYMLSPETWTVIMMAIAFLLAVYITLTYKKPAFAAVVTWALAGIWLRSLNGDSQLIYITAASLTILCGLLFLFSLLKTALISFK
ncbi:MAG: hypothetical protein KF803_05090 [Cyclobacteriaceae bacterium]|nr:hypothetical protein [Cyclobacteriaceae bacterium]